MDQQNNDHLPLLFDSCHNGRDQQLVQPIVGWFGNGFNLHNYINSQASTDSLAPIFGQTDMVFAFYLDSLVLDSHISLF